jgi:2-octaprenyl-6-methoxyphenol hydroxylase
MSRKKQKIADVVIVGGGMVGGSLALALSSSGLHVVLVEANRFVENKEDGFSKRAIALSWGSRQLLEQLGLWQALHESAMPIHHIHVSDRGHFGKTRLSAQSQQVDALGYVVEAAQIEKAVNDVLAKTNVEVICPATVVEYSRQQDRVDVTLAIKGKQQTQSCKLLVGADGGASHVRSLGGFEILGHDYQQHAVTALLQVEADTRDIAYERFTSEGPIAMLPHFDNLYSLVWTMPSDVSKDIVKIPKEEFVERLQTRFGQWLGELNLQGSVHRFPLSLAHVRDTVNERVVLIGNAAHQLHPVAGQGFNLGLRDAVALADVIMSAKADVGTEETLQRYSQQRKTDQALITGFTDNIVKLFSNDNAALSLVRNSGLLMLDKVPLFKQAFARQTMGLGTRLARLRAG